MMIRKWLVMIALAGTVATAAGCGSGRLETGYRPQKLGMTESERRALYAEPFSPDAQPRGQTSRPTVRPYRPGSGP